jgi:hypothetical protein
MNGQESAEILGLNALGWLVSQPDSLGGFLNMTGAGVADLGGLARDPHFLAGVLDFILQADETVLACAEALGVPPTAIGEARGGLPGGRDPHWT